MSIKLPDVFPSQREIQYMLSFNMIKFKDLLLQNRRYNYHNRIMNVIYERRHNLRNGNIKITNRCRSCHGIYHISYSTMTSYTGPKITFYNAMYWSKNLKFNKDKSRVITANTVTLFIISDYKSAIEVNTSTIFNVPIANLTIRDQPWRTTYNRTFYTFEFDFSDYCDSILYILRAKKHKRSLFSWLPIELIKTILLLMSY